MFSKRSNSIKIKDTKLIMIDWASSNYDKINDIQLNTA